MCANSAAPGKEFYRRSRWKDHACVVNRWKIKTGWLEVKNVRFNIGYTSRPIVYLDCDHMYESDFSLGARWCIFCSLLKFGDSTVKRVMYLQFGIFGVTVDVRGCFLFVFFLNPWCAVKLTKWRNVICEFIHGAFKSKFICQQVIGWPSIILSQTAGLPHCLMLYLILFFPIEPVHFQST